ncbi:hypothetical protein K435DRAFT_237020 [Dendrothele bispora CBS 962.96]|uniref:Uncharacterized protein n=1 Tax=Dendrothele bispora (strain CBS 962.96) TaxID=1314807 RepID=A0A4S8LPA9_DENBC|nr:hypothetical protein K435DRAFT_237020 [Dendrothele bispora CBS 962.96]
MDFQTVHVSSPAYPVPCLRVTSFKFKLPIHVSVASPSKFSTVKSIYPPSPFESSEEISESTQSSSLISTRDGPLVFRLTTQTFQSMRSEWGGTTASKQKSAGMKAQRTRTNGNQGHKKKRRW